MKSVIARSAIWFALVVPLAICASPCAFAAQKHKPGAKPKVITTKDGLKIEILAEGSGPGAKSGQTVLVDYTGWLTNGAQFDSSRKPGGKPIPVVLGAHRVIPGWEEGLLGMKKGGHRKLTIPAALGYGAAGYPPVIPANSTLIFDVEMKDIK